MASGLPIESQSSDAFVGISSPAELETVDSNNGALVGTPVSLDGTPVGVDEWWATGSAPSRVVVAEKSGHTHSNEIQELQLGSSSLTTPVSLTSRPTAVAVGGNVRYALVLEPTGNRVQVYDTEAASLVSGGSISLGLSTTDSMSITFNPNGEYAYVTDATAHKVVILQYQSTSPYFSVLSTYTGSSSFDPGQMSIPPGGSANTAYLSDGSSVDVANIATGGFSLSGSISLAASAGANAISPDGSMLYVAQPSGVAAVNTSTDAVTSWSTSITPGQLFVSNDGNLLGVTASSSGTLDLLNTTTGAVADTTSLDGTAAAAVQADALALRFVAYITKSGTGSLNVYDPTAETSSNDFGVGTDPVAVAASPDGQFAYVANKGGNSVSVLQSVHINTTSAVTLATVSLGSGTAPDAIVVNSTGDRILVADYGTGQLSVIDGKPSDANYDQVIATIDLDGSGTTSSTIHPNGIAISPDDQYVYVTEGGGGEVTVLNSTSPGVWVFDHNSTGLGLSGEPQDVVVSPNDQWAYVTDALSSGNGYLRPYKIDPQTGIFHNSSYDYTLGVTPDQIALSPRADTAYVTNSGNTTTNTVSVVDVGAGSSGSVSSLSTPGSPSGIALTPDGETLMVSNDGSAGNSVSLFNTTTDSLIATKSLSGTSPTPEGIAVSPFFDRPSTASPVGTEQDTNPVVAATNSSIAVVDGVNTATRAYTLPLDDLTLPDVGIDLDLSQEYDSANSAVTGPLGYGWSYSYGMTAVQTPAGASSTACDLTITEQNGSQAIFYAPSTGTWTSSCSGVGTGTETYQSPSFEQARISVVANCNGTDSCWDMTANGTTQYLFDEMNGDLISEIDQNGNTVSLAYDSHNHLSTVTGQSGTRSLSFTWSGTGSSATITGVTDSASRTATFTYSSGQLTSLSLSAHVGTGDPVTSHTWDFAYNSGALQCWWSPDNSASAGACPTTGTASYTYITYGSSGQVLSVTDPQWSTQCDGASGTPYCAPETTFNYPSWDASSDSGVAFVSDPDETYDLANTTDCPTSGCDGTVSTYAYVDGVIVSEVKGYGYEPNSSNDVADPMKSAVTDQVSDPFTWMPSLSLDADGNETMDTYDSSANVLSETDPLGNVTSYVYNAFNEVLSETDPLGNLTSYTYDANGNELSETDPMGDVTSYAYTSTGLTCGELSPDGYAAGDRLTSCPSGAASYVTSYGYDSAGDLTTTTSYDGTGNTVSSTYVTSSLYNSAGELCASLTADGYAAGDRLGSSCPSSGAAYETVDTAYDSFGNLVSSISPTNASGGTTTDTYDADGNTLATTDPSGDVTTSAYNADDELCWSEPTSVSGATCASPPTGTGTQTTTYVLDASGNQISTVSPDGNASTSLSCLYTTSSSFDKVADTSTITIPTGGTTCSNETTASTTDSYDGDGNVVQSSGSGPTTTTTYNGDGKVATETVGSGLSAETSTDYYDAAGNVVAVTGPAGNPSTCDPLTTSGCTDTTYDTYDKAGRQTSTTVGSGSYAETTTTYYDAAGNAIAVTGPNGNPATCDPVTTSGCTDTTYNVYDELGRLLSTTDPSGNETQYTYDADGNVLTETNPSSATATDSYDGAGRLVEVSYSDGTPTVSYQYWPNGSRCWMLQGGTSSASCTSPPAGAATYAYDTSGRLTSQTNAAGQTDTYGYDASSNVNCVSYPNSSGNTCSSSGTPTGVVRYTYNVSNEVTSLTDWAGDTLAFTYNGAGQECWVSTYAPSTPSCTSVPYQASAVTTAYSYDAVGNVSDVKTTTGGLPATNLLDLSVGTRNADNFITAETPTVGSTAENADNYGYNSANEVSSGPIAGGSSSNSYNYTPAGSITTDTTAFASAAYTDAGALCWTSPTTSTNGCSSPPSGATTYAFNADGQRTSETPPSGNPQSYGWETASGLLTCANTNGTTCSTSSPTSSTRVYSYDGDGLRLSATNNSTTTSFTWGALANASALLSDGSWDFVYVPGQASPLEQISTSGSSPTVDLLLADQSRNTRGIVQLSSGSHQYQLVNYTDYDAYGNPITESAGSVEAGGLTTSQTGLNANYVGSTPWGFGEGYTDATGLVYLVHRYYDPVTGQFVSVDPLITVTAQPYVYAQDSPMTYQDPSGQIVECHATTSTEPKPRGCDIWVDSYKAMKKLGVTPSTGGYVEVDGIFVWGPLLDLMKHVWNSNPATIVRYIVFGFHLLQANQFHRQNYSTWWWSKQVAPVNQYVEYCQQVSNQCLPPPDDVTSPPVAGGVWYLLYANQHAGTTPVSENELHAIVNFADAVEWGGDIMNLIGQ